MASPYPNGSEQTFSTTEVAYHLQVTADTLRSWTRRFGRFLSVQAGGDDPRYTTSDVAALVMVQKLIEQGLNDEQVGERLTPKRIVRDESPSLAMSADQGRQIVDARLCHAYCAMSRGILGAESDSQAVWRARRGVGG